MCRESGGPKGAPRLTARRFQRLPSASNGPRPQAFNRGLIQPWRGHRQARQALGLRQGVNQAAKPAIHIIPPRTEGKPNPRIAQRIDEGRGRQIPCPFRQQRGRKACRAFPPRRIKGCPARPGPGKRDHRDGMIFHQPGGQPMRHHALNGQAKGRAHALGNSQAAVLGALGKTALAAAST